VPLTRSIRDTTLHLQTKQDNIGSHLQLCALFRGLDCSKRARERERGMARWQKMGAWLNDDDIFFDSGSTVLYMPGGLSYPSIMHARSAELSSHGSRFGFVRETCTRGLLACKEHPSLLVRWSWSASLDRLVWTAALHTAMQCNATTTPSLSVFFLRLVLQVL
jgi:hypothetical protein